MAKLTDQLEDYIKKGDWVGVCSVFKKLTGRDVSPPKQAPITKKITKKSLYAELSESMELAPIGEYTLDDLKDMVALQATENVETDDLSEIEPPKDGEKNISANPEFTYIPEKKRSKILNMDKERLAPRFTELGRYDDEDKPPVPRTRKQLKKTVACRSCHQSASIHPSLIIKGIDGQETYICPKCK